MEVQRDPRQVGWRSSRDHGRDFNEAVDDDIETRHEDFIDAGHRVLIHLDAELGGPGRDAAGALEDMRVEARKVHLFRVLVLVVTAILAAYIYSMYTSPVGEPVVPGMRAENRATEAAGSSGSTLEGRSLSGEEATISLLVYALLEAANREVERKTQLAREGR